MSSLESPAESDSPYFELSAKLPLANQERYLDQVTELLNSKKLSGQLNDLEYRFVIIGDGVDFSYAPIGESNLHQSSWLRLNQDRDLAVDALIQFMAHAEAEMTLFNAD